MPRWCFQWWFHGPGACITFIPFSVKLSAHHECARHGVVMAQAPALNPSLSANHECPCHGGARGRAPCLGGASSGGSMAQAPATQIPCHDRSAYHDCTCDGGACPGLCFQWWFHGPGACITSFPVSESWHVLATDQVPCQGGDPSGDSMAQAPACHLSRSAAMSAQPLCCPGSYSAVATSSRAVPPQALQQAGTCLHN